MEEDSFWRKFINALPTEEFEDSISTKESVLKKEVDVLRLKLDIYLMTPIGGESSKAYMVNGNQQLEAMGILTIKEALEIIKSRNSRSKE